MTDLLCGDCCCVLRDDEHYICRHNFAESFYYKNHEVYHKILSPHLRIDFNYGANLISHRVLLLKHEVIDLHEYNVKINYDNIIFMALLFDLIFNGAYLEFKPYMYFGGARHSIPINRRVLINVELTSINEIV